MNGQHAHDRLRQHCKEEVLQCDRLDRLRNHRRTEGRERQQNAGFAFVVIFDSYGLHRLHGDQHLMQRAFLSQQKELREFQRQFEYIRDQLKWTAAELQSVREALKNVFAAQNKDYDDNSGIYHVPGKMDGKPGELRK